MDPLNQKFDFDKDKYEENTLREKDSICPFIRDVCPKDPKLCGRYQPFNIIDMVLNVPKIKTVYMCIDDSMRMTEETILQLIQSLVASKPKGFSQINPFKNQ